jgi:di/tricarboxylate transporter
LGGYAEANVWLIVAAVFFSRGIINSGLGKRIAYTLIRAFGTSSLKLAYALACTDLIISPATPSHLKFSESNLRIISSPHNTKRAVSKRCFNTAL